MKLSHATCVVLAPALASAAAFATPEPTHRMVAADNWSPAPTEAPQFNIFGREVQQANQDKTCGYVSGLSASPVSCPNSNAVCATNNFYGVHGCCDPSSLSSCTIATACIASTAMKSQCTNDACLSDAAVAKCTASTAAECYQWLFVYETTTMVQHGCTASGFTSTAYRKHGPLTTSSPSPLVVTVTESVSSAHSPTWTPTASGDKKQTLGPIIGGTVGGCTIISLVALAAFLIHRRRQKAKQAHSLAHPPPTSSFHHNTPDFDPNGFPATGWSTHDIKTWQQQQQQQQQHSGVLQPGQTIAISEVHGHDRAVEVEAPEKTKSGHWHAPGRGPVEVEASQDEKRRWWRGPVEAPS